MSPDSIDTITVDLYDFLVDKLGCDLCENADFEALNEWMLDKFEPFYTKDRNYN